MGAAEKLDPVRMTEEEYLAMDRASLDCKHEYVDGEVFAMAGGSWNHSKMIHNLSALIHHALRGKPCQGASSELRVKVGKTYVYPDATIVCGQPTFADNCKDILTNPTVVFEVLSPSTEAYDRGRKSEGYREVESLHEYLLLSQEKQMIEHFTRQRDGTWSMAVYKSGDIVKLHAPEIELSVAEIYERVFDV